MKKLNIIGASGHGKVVADIALQNGYSDIKFWDDDHSKESCGQYPVAGRSNEVGDGDIFIAIGDPHTRKALMDYYDGRVFPVLIHPSAVISSDVSIGEGTVVAAGTVISPDSAIGRGCIINTCSSVDHDCVVGDYCHVSVGAHLSGTVSLGDEVWIGAGAIVSNNIRICSGSVIGAGAVVIRDIDTAGTYVGVPARLGK